MPCESMQTVETVLENVKDINLLKAALEAMGYTVDLYGKSLSFYGMHKGIYTSGTYANGVIETAARSPQVDVNTLKKHMGVASLKKRAKKLGWTLKPVKGSEFKYEVLKG